MTASVPAGTQAYDVTILDTLGDGLVFDTTLSSGLAAGSAPACPAPASLAQLDPHAVADGSTRLGWWVGDVAAPITGPCAYEVSYRARIAHSYQPEDVAVRRGHTLTNLARAGWNLTDQVATPPATPPDAAVFAAATSPIARTVTVSEPVVVIDKDVNVAGCDATPGNSDDVDTCRTEPGASYVYTLTIRNTGDHPAYDVEVTDTPDADLVDVVANPTAGVTLIDGWTAVDPAMCWVIAGPIAPGGSVSITTSADLAASATLSDTTQIINTADVATYHAADTTTRTARPGDFRTYGNDPSGPGGDVTADTVALELRTPHVAVVKTAVSDATDARAGVPFTWQIVATNATGADVAAAYDVTVRDALPAGWSYVAGSARVTTPYAADVVVEPTGTTTLEWADLVTGPGQPLAPGASITVRFAAVPAASLLTVGTTGTFDHTNTASVSAADATGATGNLTGPYNGLPDPESARIRRIDLSVAKSVAAGPHFFGSYVDYTVQVHNAGPDAATGVTVHDELPTGLLHRSTVSATHGTYNPTTGLWTVGTIANGGSATLVLRVQINAIGPIVNTAEVNHADQWDVDSFPRDTVGSDVGEDDIASVTITAAATSFGDLVWLDRNADGVVDAGEPGIPDVRVVLHSAGNDGVFGTADDYWGPDGAPGGGDDITVTSVLTNAFGNYGFVDLPIGNYRAEVDTTTLPGGLRPTFNDDAVAGPDLDHLSGVVNLATPYLDADFGYTGTSTLGDTVWFDIDGDGLLDPGEPGLGGIGVLLL